MQSQILSYCRINNHQILVDHRVVLENSAKNSGSEFLTEAYRSLELSYPKYYKMDLLCRLGTIATEYLFRHAALKEADKHKMGLVFANRSSSLDTDRTHAAAIADKQQYFPSPSVFVYTLPNIVTGEIAIKHGITGENAFFVSEKFDAPLISTYSNILLDGTQTESLLCGWVEAGGGQLDALVYWVKKGIFETPHEGFNVPHETEQINKLYAI